MGTEAATSSSKKKKTGTEGFILELFAGGFSGIVTKTSTAPLERVKILLQLQGMALKQRNPNAEAPPQLKYRGIWHTLTTTLKEEGLRGWFKGNGANVVRVVPVYALKFAFNDTFKDLIRGKNADKSKKLSFAQLMASGTLAGLFQQVCTYPLETIRTRLTMGALSTHQYTGIIDCLRKTVKDEGVRGLYKGLGPTILTGSPYVGLQMTFYEELNRITKPAEGSTEMRIQAQKLINGALAGIVAQTLTYPGDTVRRRMQTDGMRGETKMYANAWDCFYRVLRQEGVKTLFAGLYANVVRGIPGAGIQFAVYDGMKVLLGI